MVVPLYRQMGKGKTRRYQKVNLGRGRRRAPRRRGAAATFKVVSDSELTAVVPAAAVTGGVKVITAAKRTLTGLSKLKVLPAIKSISPTSGPVDTVVKITGSGLTEAAKVTFDGKVAAF